MSNYMKNVAEMLGVKLHEGFYVVHNNGRSLVVLEEEGIRFINHIGCLKEDAPAICLQEILNGNFQIEHIEEREDMNINKENFIETTTKFNELKKEFDREFYAQPSCWGGGDPKINALKSTMDKLLSMLDELVRQ